MNVNVSAVAVICKTDEARRLFYAPVLIPDVVDLQGDVVTRLEIEMAAHSYLSKARKVGIQHGKTKNDIEGGIYEDSTGVPWEVVESFIIPEPGMSIGGTFFPAGTWFMVGHILDEKVWAAVVSGALTGLSIGGTAVRTPT